MAFRLTVNLGNSIIGVSILTMPFCFRTCGILLSVLLLLVSGLLNRAGCHLLLRCAVLTRKRSFEDMALEVLGPAGKLLVELCILGFLIGTCVAYFVVIGDLTPSIVSDVTGWPNSPHLRAFTITAVAMFIALPLSLLRRADSLSSFSALSFLIYALLAVKLFSETSVNLMTAADPLVRNRFVWWDTEKILQYIPIFAMALSCQTQLFELFDHSFLNFDGYDVVPKLNRIVRRAIHMCSLVYLSIGIFGYVAFHDLNFGGNILSALPASIGSTLMKTAFIATVAVSLPLCLFPCRTSLHSLFMKSNRRDHSRSTLMNEFVSSSSSHYMSDRHFRILTVLLIVFTVSVSIIVPKIEFVLSIIGSTTGTIICFVLPGLMYTQATHKNTTERLLAQFLTYCGLFILVVCTFSSLSSFSRTDPLDQDISLHPHSNDKVAESAVHVVLPFVSKKSNNLVDAGPAIESGAELQLKQEELMRKLEKNQEEQKKLIEEQKKVLQEFNKHEQVHRKSDKPIVVPGQGSNQNPDTLQEKSPPVRSGPAVVPHVPEISVSERKESANLPTNKTMIVRKEVSERSAAAHIHDLHNESVKVTASRQKDALAVKDF
jgi:amino acid permease